MSCKERKSGRKYSQCQSHPSEPLEDGLRVRGIFPFASIRATSIPLTASVTSHACFGRDPGSLAGDRRGGGAQHGTGAAKEQAVQPSSCCGVGGAAGCLGGRVGSNASNAGLEVRRAQAGAAVTAGKEAGSALWGALGSGVARQGRESGPPVVAIQKSPGPHLGLTTKPTAEPPSSPENLSINVETEKTDLSFNTQGPGRAPCEGGGRGGAARTAPSTRRLIRRRREAAPPPPGGAAPAGPPLRDTHTGVGGRTPRRARPGRKAARGSRRV